MRIRSRLKRATLSFLRKVRSRFFKREKLYSRIESLCNKTPLFFWDHYTKVKSVKCSPGKRGFSSNNSPWAKDSESKSGNYDSEYFFTILTEKILPFWAQCSIDTEEGGYLVHLNRDGTLYDSSRKFAAMQARMIYAFSVGCHICPSRDYRELAEQGVDFLIKNFWDDRYGGWVRTVQRSGNVVDDRKHMFDQSYILIGLCQYYCLTRDSTVLSYLLKTCDVIRKHAWDKKSSGYYELFENDWSVQVDIKTACGHLDALAAMLQMNMAVGGEDIVDHIQVLADILINRMMDDRYGIILEHFSSDWRYLPVSTNDQIEFGHNLKMAWVLMRAYEILNDKELLEVAKRLIHFCLLYGWDAENGGFYQDGYRNGLLASNDKLWWPECEGLLALSRLYTLTNEDIYRDALKSLTYFIENSFYDPEYGEWYTSVEDNGTPKNSSKGGNYYKSAFHTVEAYWCTAKEIKGRI